MNTRLPEKGQARWFVLILLLVLAAVVYTSLRLTGALTPPAIVPSQPSTPTQTLKPTDTPTVAPTSTLAPTTTPTPTLTPTVEPTATEVALVAQDFSSLKTIAFNSDCIKRNIGGEPGSSVYWAYTGAIAKHLYTGEKLPDKCGSSPCDFPSTFPSIHNSPGYITAVMAENGCIFIVSTKQYSTSPGGRDAGAWFENNSGWHWISIQP